MSAVTAAKSTGGAGTHLACPVFATACETRQRPHGAADEWRIPRREVHEVIEAAFERYDVVELASDPPGWYSELDGWAELYGERVVEFETKQPKRTAPACERFRAGVLDGRLTHGGQSLLAEHVGNCVARETPLGTVVGKDHPDSPRKIDATVAAVIAYERAMWHAQDRKPTSSWHPL